MTSNQVEVPSESNFEQTPELSWLPFLLKLTERLTTDSIQEFSKFALTSLVQATGAVFGDIKLLVEPENDRLNTELFDQGTPPISSNAGAQLLATCDKVIFTELPLNLSPNIPYGQGAFWQAVETREPVFVEDCSSYLDESEPVRHSNPASLGIFPIRNADGTVVGTLTLRTQNLPGLQASPNYDAVVATCRVMGSLLEQERTKQELTWAKAELQLAQFSLEQMSDACFWLRSDGQFEAVNEAACKHLGYSRTELLTLKVSDIDPNFSPENWSDFWQNHKNWSGSTFESLHWTSNGQLIPVEITGNYLDFKGKEYCFAAVRNISDRKQHEAQRQQTEEALRRSETQFRRIADSNIIGIIFSSNNGQIYDANDAFLGMVGYTRQDLEAGRVRWDEITPPEYLPLDEFATHQLIATGVAIPWEKEYICKDGHRIAVLIGCALLEGERDKTIGFVQNITAHKQIEALLQRANEHLGVLVEERTVELKGAVEQLKQEIRRRKQTQTQLQNTLQRLNFHFENSPLAVIEWDADLRITRWSREAETIFGWKAEAVLGRQLDATWQFIHDEDKEAVAQTLTRLFSGQLQRSVFLNRNYTQTGETVYCEWYNSVLIDQAGNVISMLSLVQNITDRKLAEEELERQGLRSRLFADTSLKIRQSLQLDQILQTTVTEVRELLLADRVLIYQLAADGTGTVMTEAIVPGFNRLVGMQFVAEVFPADHHAQYRKGQVRCIDNIETAGLSPCHIEFLRKLNVRAKLVVPLLQGAELWGLMIAHQCNAPRQWSGFEVELLQQLADQVGIALGQAQLLQALRSSEEKFRQLTENIQQVFWMRDPRENRVVYVSPAYEQIWGSSCEKLYQDRFAWMSAMYPQDRDRILAVVEDHSLKQFDEEYRICRADGALRWIRDRAFPVKDDTGNIHLIAGIAEDITDRKQQEERLRLLESVIVNANDAVLITEAEPVKIPGPRIIYANAAFSRLTGYSLEEVLGKTPRILQGPKTNRKTLAKIRDGLKRWQPILVELINYRKDGSEFWVELSIVPVADQNGWYTHWVAIQRDITRRKQLEEELLKTLDKEKELSELKSRFVSMTSHEFRTPLSTIYSASELLEYYWHRWTEEERQDQLHLIQETVEHMTQLLEDILLIGQAEADRLEFHPTWIDLTQFCYELTTNLQLSIGRKHTLIFVSRCSVAMAWVDEKLLRQILTNLLSNGVKYSPIGSSIQLELACDPDQAILYVYDQGIGIPPEDHAHLFEPFHRAKNVGTVPGTGLGLAIVKQCVDVHGGTITLSSQVNVGTTFKVMLPLEGTGEAG
jgi:PAS domain S-box-containing protein